jgi:hypothetical protein
MRSCSCRVPSLLFLCYLQLLWIDRVVTKWGLRTLSPAFTGVHNRSLPSTPLLPCPFFKSLHLEYCKCNCLPARSPIDVPEATSRLPLIARWQKVDSRKKPPQTLWVSLCEKEKRRIEVSLAAKHQMLADTSQSIMKTLKHRLNRLE